MYRGFSPAQRRGSAPVAVSFVSKLHGASQPSIIMTTGAELWVVKFGNFGGPSALLNEVVGTELMALLGLPVPVWTPVRITDEFIDRNPEVWFQGSGVTRFRPEPGLHFGSRLTLSTNGLPTYQVIPKSWYHCVTNREDFVGALAADLWTNNCDRLQFVLVSSRRHLHASFIDHDNLFGGFRGNENTSPRRLMMPTPELFLEAAKPRVIARWMKAIDKVSEAVLDHVFEQIPADWADSSTMLRARVQLTNRKNRLESLLHEAQSFLKNPNAGYKMTARHAVEPRMLRGPDGSLYR